MREVPATEPNRVNDGSLATLFARYVSDPGSDGDELAEHVRSLTDLARTDLDSDLWRD